MTSEKATEIFVAGINLCHALSADMKALKFLNFMYKEAIQHENINPEDFTGELFIVWVTSRLQYWKKKRGKNMTVKKIPIANQQKFKPE